MAQGAKGQLGAVAKGAVKQILQEPTEILKDVGEQVAPFETGGQQQTTQPLKQVTPSLEEQKKERILAAHRRELEEEVTRQRENRVREAEAQNMAEEKKEEEKKQVEEAKSETFFQKGLKLVTRRLKRRVETRLPKAA
ncbi:hypothetical protein HYV21_01965 [Candidatus Microgenomates bacterium]|nr:hypothetical protein [Candidatus Microgenomates bacterium]